MSTPFWIALGLGLFLCALAAVVALGRARAWADAHAPMPPMPPCDACRDNGWLVCLVDHDPHRPEIQRCDHCQRFESDDEARTAAGDEGTRAVAAYRELYAETTWPRKLAEHEAEYDAAQPRCSRCKRIAHFACECGYCSRCHPAICPPDCRAHPAWADGYAGGFAYQYVKAIDLQEGMINVDGQAVLDISGGPSGDVLIHWYTPRPDDEDEDLYNRSMPESQVCRGDALIAITGHVDDENELLAETTWPRPLAAHEAEYAQQQGA